jgi:hypothetical protein
LEKISSSNVFAKKIPVPKDNLTLIVDDFDAKNQQVFSLNFGLPPENRDLPVPGELVREEKSSSLGNCTGFVCSNGFTCASQPKESANGPCCYSECVSSGVFSGTDGALSVPLIAWLALLFLIIALWVARSALKGVKKK